MESQFAVLLPFESRILASGTLNDCHNAVGRMFASISHSTEWAPFRCVQRLGGIHCYPTAADARRDKDGSRANAIIFPLSSSVSPQL